MVPHRANLSVCSVGPMRVTIFGGHGKIALLLAPMLVEAGHEVTSVVRNPDRTYAVDRDAAIRSMDAAAAAGARRYVMVSFSGSDPDVLVPEDNPFRHYQDAKIAADDHLRGTDLDWTVLGPGTLTLEPGTGSVNPDAGFNDGDVTSRELVAQVTLAVLADERSHGRTLVFGDGDVPIDDWLASL